MQSWLAKWRLAWRDLRAQGGRSIFFALLVAAGVASLVGVQGMAGSLASSMQKNARQMVQGDLVVSHTQPLTAAQQAALDRLQQEGAELTTTWQTTNVVRVMERKAQTIVEVKVVDPQVWPFYGGFQSSPANVKPGKGEALVGPTLLTRMGLKVGDTIQVGDAHLKIIGTVLAEPSSFAAGIPLGPRVLVAQDAFRQPTSADKQNIMIKLPPTIQATKVKARLQADFPAKGVVQTYQDAWKSFATVMDSIFTFLSMVALISLLVGGLGVAMAMRTFISQKLEQIAVLKALGATSRSVMTIFLIEAALLGLGGSLVGVFLGLGVQILLPKLLTDLLPVAVDGLNWAAAAGGLAAGVGIAVLCALIPVRAVRNVKPVALFRGEGISRMGWKAWLEAGLVSLLTLGGVTWVAMIYAKSTRVGVGFIGGLLVASLLLFLLTWVLLRFTRLLPQSGRPAIRHAVRSLRAPGNQSSAVVVAMGLGIMLMTTVYLLQYSLMNQVRDVGAGPDTPNIYVRNVTAENKSEILSYLQHHPQVSKVPTPISIVTTTLVSVDGTPAAQRNLPGSLKKPFEMPASSKELPHGMQVVAGEWFTPEDAGKPLLTVKKGAADSLGLKPGSKVVFLLKNEPVTFTVKSVIDQSGQGVITAGVGLLNAAPGSLDAYADAFVLTAVSKPHQEEAVVTDLMQKYPSVMPISLGTLMNLLDDLLGKIANILRFVTGFAVIAAGVILSGSLSATQLRRRKEAALLKSLGATRATVAVASSLENGLLGAVAGLAGSGLGYALIKAASVALKMTVGVSAWPLLVATLAGALLAVLVGIAATVDALQVKPLGILRSE